MVQRSATNALVRRKQAVDATIEKFAGREFAWGSVDCGKLVAFHLKRLGHTVSLSKGGPYRSAATAQRALEKVGFLTLPAFMDARFERMAPAFMLVGDVFQAPGDHAIGALGIYVGNGNGLAFHETQTLPAIITLNVSAITSAWRTF